MNAGSEFQNSSRRATFDSPPVAGISTMYPLTLKIIRDPPGENFAPDPSGATTCASEPSAFIRLILSPLVNAIVDPSGEKTG